MPLRTTLLFIGIQVTINSYSRFNWSVSLALVRGFTTFLLISGLLSYRVWGGITIKNWWWADSNLFTLILHHFRGATTTFTGRLIYGGPRYDCRCIVSVGSRCELGRGSLGKFIWQSAVALEHLLFLAYDGSTSLQQILIQSSLLIDELELKLLLFQHGRSRLLTFETLLRAWRHRKFTACDLV